MNRTRATEITFLLLRLVAGLLFFHAGAMKMFGWFGGMPDTHGPARLLTQTGIGGVLEVVGGAAIMLGLFTRPVAFILSGEMAVAYWQFHAPKGTWPIENHGQQAVLFCFLFLYMSAVGAGPWSLDGWIARSREKRSGPHSTG